MTVVARVVYEDKGGPVHEFGLHKLVVACVAAKLGLEVWQVDRCLDSIPRNGNGNVVRACRSEARLLCQRGTPLIAVLDEDKIRRHVGLAPAACRTEIVAAIKQGSTAAALVEVVLLRQNLETVLECIARVRPSWENVQVALRKGRHALNERDMVLGKAARDLEVQKRVMDEVPSFARLVDTLANRVKAAYATPNPA